MLRWVVLAGLLAASCAPRLTTPGPIGAAQEPWRQQEHAIPVRNEDGSTALLAGRTCLPDRPGPARLAVIAHGAPPLAENRTRMQLTSCDSEAARWFLSRGFAVAFALRRGYGATGGAYYESSTGCTVDAYVRAAHESARDLEAVVDYATALPGVRPDGVVVVGQSAGGWAALGLDSVPHPKVIAVVSMAGGRGGHNHNAPNSNCSPENLETAAGVLGRTSPTPMLWIYTENDSYFAPPIARAMHAAFTGSGGMAELHLLGPFAADGHTLFFGRGGSAVWSPLMEAYLRQRGAFPTDRAGGSGRG